MANVSIKQVCIKMGLSPISSSYEAALANYLGTSQVNGSWIQGMYPTIQTMKDQLDSQTYSGITRWANNYFDGLFYDFPFDGMQGYCKEENFDGGSYRQQGLYIWSDAIANFEWQPSNLLTWMTDEFVSLFQINNTDSVQTQNVSTLQTLVAEPTYANTPSVSLNTSNQLSTTKKTRVSYTVSVATALNLLNLTGGGQVLLEISANNSTWVTINSAGISRTLSLGVSVGLNETSYFNIQGEVPKSYYRRLRTVTSGGATVAFVSGQEVQY